MKKVTSKKEKATRVLVAGMALSLGLTACTKSRDTKVADEVTEAELVTRAELEQEGYAITLSGDVRSLDFDGKPVAVNEKPSFAVQKVQAPGKLQGLLKGASIHGKAGQNLAIRFKLETKNLFVLKRIDDASELGTLEKDLVIKENGIQFLPIYAIPVKSVGILVRQKNDYGEQTFKQELRETDLTQATHARLDLRKEALKAIEIPRNNPEARREIFLASQLDNKVSTVSEVDQLLQTNLGFQNPNEKILTRIQKSSDTASAKVQVLVYSLRNKSDIKDKKLLAKLNSSQESLEISKCSAEIEQASGLKGDCVLVLERSLEGTSVRAKVELDSEGKPTTTVAFEEVSADKRMSLIRIGKNSPTVEAGPEALRRWNPINTIQIADIKDKEFLFRRTFQDAPSSLTAFGPGASGNLEIVKIELEEDRIVVRRSDTINSDRKAGQIDREELMSIPVRYYKLTTANGVRLAQPKAATKFDADVISLDWTNNTLPVIASPLSFFEAGQCFVTSGNQSIEDMDMRLDQGVLNFSISGTYAFRPECMSYFGLNDYFWGGGLQTNFNLVERVSFRVHDKSRDQLQNIDLPFRAQTLLGFGLFTMGKKAPDQFGNTGRVGNEQALPIVHDFTNGKVLTYTLGGLPQDPKYREIFIRTTKQVVDDWNETLHKSFAGTSLARSGDYIKLQVDGVDVPAGKLGDLDRNYIWNFDKNIDSGLLGMAQPGPNPRTGFTEANNVLMYSGNLLAYIGYEKRSAQIVTEYNQMKEAAKLSLLKDEKKSETPEQAATPEQGAAQVAEKAAPESQNQIRRWIELSKNHGGPRTPILNVKPSELKAQALAAVQVATRGEDLSIKKQQAAQIAAPKKAYLRRIVERALEMQVTDDPAMLEALSSAEILKTYGKELSEEARVALEFQTRRLALAATFQKNFKKVPGCVMTASGIPSLNASQLATTSTEEIFSNWYAKTLSHEIGHAIGLTHNFMGSTDKMNFAFNEDKDKGIKRDYSTIMDYFPGSHINYQKPGPYDMHALRAAYTGFVEVDSAVVAKYARRYKGQIVLPLKNPENQDRVVTLVNGNLIHLNDLKDIVIPGRKDEAGKIQKSWWDATGQNLSALPTKYYRFCTDIHAGLDPMCNRWDAGTTPEEVAKFYINEYNENYPLLNARNDRINSVGMGSYLGRIMGNFFAIRQFFDETFYRAIQGDPNTAQYLPAAFEAYQFFMNIFNTPSLQADVNDANRFSVVDYMKTEVKKDSKGKDIVGKDGKPELIQVKAKTVIESKATKDIFTSGFSDLVSTRGSEFDKALALMMLTQRETGNPRYTSLGLRLSFADFEKYALQMKPEQSLLLRALQGSLSDSLTSIMFVDGNIVKVPMNLAPETSDVIRYFTVLSSAIYLEADTLEDKDNFAALFRVGSSLGNAPADRFVVTKLDQNPSSPGSLKLWAFDNASVAFNMTRDAAQKRVLLTNMDALTSSINDIIMAKDEASQKAAIQASITLIESLNKDGVLINEEDTKQGITPLAIIGYVVKNVQETAAQAVAFYEFAKKQGWDDDRISENVGSILREQRNGHVLLSKNMPFVVLATDLVHQNTKDKPVLQAIVAALTAGRDDLKTNVGIMINNLQTLNKIVIMMNPELNR